MEVLLEALFAFAYACASEVFVCVCVCVCVSEHRIKSEDIIDEGLPKHNRVRTPRG